MFPVQVRLLKKPDRLQQNFRRRSRFHRATERRLIVRRAAIDYSHHNAFPQVFNGLYCSSVNEIVIEL
jgi:hypothetical protein